MISRRTLRNGAIGAVVGGVLGFVPLVLLVAPVIGGGAGYRLTALGTTMLKRIERFRDEPDRARHPQPLLERIDAPELRENTHLFVDATVAVATPQNPNAPVDCWLEHFESFDRFRGLVVAGCPPAVTEQGVDTLRARWI